MEAIHRRGPHGVRTVQSGRVTIMASVLHMRGDDMVPQPVELKMDGSSCTSSSSLPLPLPDSCWFCWNGEVYEMTRETNGVVTSQSLPLNESDTTRMANALYDALREPLKPNGNDDHNDDGNTNTSVAHKIALVLGRIWNGEYAFCLCKDDRVYYGRDRLGRRSLLVSESEESWVLSSVGTKAEGNDQGNAWTEVLPGRVFEYDPSTKTTTSVTIPLMEPPHPSENSIDDLHAASLRLEHLLFEATRHRLVNFQHHKSVGVLFSGGLDSVVLAAMAAKLLLSSPMGQTIENDDGSKDDDKGSPIHQSPSLELFNVAFGMGKSNDRQAALQSFEEMKTLFPTLDMRLVCVNVTEWDSVVAQDQQIQHLISPKSSVMDLNIGTALWFASRGVPASQSDCRILLLGMGADEQMGGYTRHRKAYREGRLREELDMDIGRLWERNLGRDDRVVSDHGKEARFPFLDANVVRFLSTLPLERICDFTLPPGEGDKRILRLIAQRMGLQTASGLVKRAIQFGSRIAHESDKRRFGSRRKAKGEHDIAEGEATST